MQHPDVYIDMCNFLSKLCTIEFNFKVSPTYKPNTLKCVKFVTNTIYKDFVIELVTDFKHSLIISYCYNGVIFFSISIGNLIVSSTSIYELPFYMSKFAFNTYLKSEDYKNSFFAKELIKFIKVGLGINIFSKTKIPDLSDDAETILWLSCVRNIGIKNKYTHTFFQCSKYNKKNLFTFMKSLYRKYIGNDFLIDPLHSIIIDFIV